MNATLPQPRPLAPLSTRRRVVLLAVGGYALYLLTVVLNSLYSLADALFVPLALAGMLLLLTGGLQLMKPARLGLPEGRDRQMDERQWQRLSQAHITAYRLLGALFLLAVAYFLLAFSNSHLPRPSTWFAWNSIYLGAIIFVPALPTAVLAWTEPDADPTDE